MPKLSIYNIKAMTSIGTFIFFLFFFNSCGIKKRKFDQKPDLGKNIEQGFLTAEDSLSNFGNTKVLTDWWSQFNDPILDTLLNKARKNNKDINQAVANFYAARAGYKSSKFDRFPTVTANGGFIRQRLGENVFVSGSNPTFNQYDGTLDANWEIGLFGRIGNRIRAAQSFEQAQLAGMQNIYLSIFAEIASTYMILRGTQNQLKIAIKNIESQNETYELTKRLTIAGTGNKLDEARAQAQYETTRASVPPIQARITELNNRLSVLIGELPGTVEEYLGSPLPIPSLPITVSVGNIQDLIRRRPDIFQSESLLSQQMAIYNLTAAEIFPKISFNGNIGFSAINFDNFGQNESFIWSIAPNISWAAFNLGRVKQNINQQDALTLGLIEQYKQTVLLALEEIKTTMSFYQGQSQRRDDLILAVEASRLAAKLSRDRYEAGLDDFLDVLNAQLTVLQAENELAVAETNAAAGLIAVYKSLGGGWEIIDPEETENKFQNLKEGDETTN